MKELDAYLQVPIPSISTRLLQLLETYLINLKLLTKFYRAIVIFVANNIYLYGRVHMCLIFSGKYTYAVGAG